MTDRDLEQAVLAAKQLGVTISELFTHRVTVRTVSRAEHEREIWSGLLRAANAWRRRRAQAA